LERLCSFVKFLALLPSVVTTVENQQELPEEDHGRGGRFDPWSNATMTLGVFLHLHFGPATTIQQPLLTIFFAQVAFQHPAPSLHPTLLLLLK
jgi:hypothetical protein